MQLTFASEPAPTGPHGPATAAARRQESRASADARGHKGPMNRDTPGNKRPMNGGDTPGARVNEDLVVAGNGFVVVLDGATAPAGVESGCVHSVAWLVGELARQLTVPLVGGSEEPLADLLAEAITGVGRVHGGTCDLSNPDSPSSTVSIVRVCRGRLDYLVLADSPVVMRYRDKQIEVVFDDRVDLLPEYTLEAVRRLRNSPDGFWAASTASEAAYEALAGTRDLEDLDVVAVLTDGASRYADRYGHSWSELLELLQEEGPAELIRRVHAADAAAPAGKYRGKRYDDATVALWSL
ncbi:protein phosphatase 2C domain-containing protein [Kribbella deserti]|uniref:Protein phosphatase 2C domain-containing protein n=1 Tax=Kribbella deserti TaxID=1926257 RepID=A0ABV6QTT4_9ACTN